MLLGKMFRDAKVSDQCISLIVYQYVVALFTHEGRASESGSSSYA